MESQLRNAVQTQLEGVQTGLENLKEYVDDYSIYCKSHFVLQSLYFCEFHKQLSNIKIIA